MPVNHEMKLIFVHIPKTAGTSIEFALGMHGKKESIGLKRYLNQEKDYSHLFGDGLQHLKIKQIKRQLTSDIFNSYYKFSIVRNPFDRLVSYIAWLHGGWEKRGPLTRETFTNYILNAQKLFSSRKFSLPAPQKDFIFIRKKLMIDLLLPFEDLNNSLEELSLVTGIDLTLEHRMKSNHKDYRTYYDRKSIDFVKWYYRKDFEYLNYSSDGL